MAALLDAAGVVSGVRVLDAGTGPGFIALEAAGRGALVQAVDQSAAMVGIATAAGVDAYESGVQQLPFDDGSFNAVVAGYLLNHLPQPDAAVAEMRRVLVPGGMLAVTIWDVPEQNPAIGLLGSVCAELGLSADVPPGPDPYRFADEARMRSLLRAWGDVVVERLRWMIQVEPGAWFDAIADSTPRSGAVLAQAGSDDRATARQRFTELANVEYGLPDGRVALPAGAVLASARRT